MKQDLHRFYSSHDFYPKEFMDSERKRLGRLFDQEHPKNALLAFITSGQLYFDQDALRDLLSMTREVMA